LSSSRVDSPNDSFGRGLASSGLQASAEQDGQSVGWHSCVTPL